MNFGVVDEQKIIDNNVETINNDNVIEKSEYHYLELLGLISSGISFDLSMHSTGITIWYNNKLEHHIIDVSYYRDNEEEMRREFKKAIIQFMLGKKFEYVCVEDVYGGQNFVTVRNLLALNTVPEEIISEDICECENFFREPNTEWKAALKTISFREKAVNDKIGIRQMLTSLGFDLSTLDKFNIHGKNDRDQDIADSLGMLLAIIAREKLGTYEKKTKYKLSDMKIWWCEDLLDYELCYNNGEEYDVIDITKNIELSLLRAIESVSANKTICAEVSTDILGTWGIRRGIPLECDKICIVCTPKGTKKPRKHKKKGTIIIS